MTPVDAIRAGDLQALDALLDQAGDPNQLDEHGWTLLNWAAGQGRRDMVARLLERGADVFARGRDNRTAYLIALAAGHVETARLLAEAEARAGGDTDATSSRQEDRRAYCKAYRLAMLKAFPGWAALAQAPAPNGPAAPPPDAARDPVTDDDLVFVHQDYTVTSSITHGWQVLLSSTTTEWRAFCTDTLDFRVRRDLER